MPDTKVVMIIQKVAVPHSETRVRTYSNATKAPGVFKVR